MSDSTHDDKDRFLHKEAIKRKIVSLTQAGSVAGNRQARYLTQLGMLEDRIATGYDTVDNAHFSTGAQTVRRASACEPELRHLPQQYFLCCARFAEVKNISRLIEAFHGYRMNALHSGCPPWQLVLVGDGPLRPEIEGQVCNLELTEFVQLVGFKDYQELPAYYGLADAFVLASVSEPWGLVVNEAMAAGLPVLISDRCGCASDLVAYGRNGFTFNPDDVQGLSALFTHIASDACNRIEMSTASQEIIAQWDLDRFVAGLNTASRIALNAPKKRMSFVDRILMRVVVTARATPCS